MRNVDCQSFHLFRSASLLLFQYQGKGPNWLLALLLSQVSGNQAKLFASKFSSRSQSTLNSLRFCWHVSDSRWPTCSHAIIQVSESYEHSRFPFTSLGSKKRGPPIQHDSQKWSLLFVKQTIFLGFATQCEKSTFFAILNTEPSEGKEPCRVN